MKEATRSGLAWFERRLIAERTRAGLASARARGRHQVTPAQRHLAQTAMGKPETRVAASCAELGLARQTLYRHVTRDGQVRPDGKNR